MIAAAVALVGSAGMLTPRAAVASDLWIGGTDVNWATAANWTGGTTPASGDSLEFNAAGTSGLSLVDNLMTPSTYNVSGITFDATAGAFIFNASAGTNGFTLTGAITNNGSSLETINDSITLSGSSAFTTAASGGNLLLGGNIGGTGGSITTAGAGILTLSGANSYTGGTTVAAGTQLNINSATAIGAAASTLTINGGTIDNTSGSAKILTANNKESWNGNFTFVGTNSLNLGSGAVNLSGGTIQVTLSNAASNLSVGAITNTTGGLTLAGPGTLTAAGLPNVQGTLTINSGTLQTTQDVHVLGLVGSGTVTDPTTADKWVFVTNSVAANNDIFAGSITGGLSKLGLNYTGGLGSLTLTNSANVINDAINVNSGNLVFQGTHINTTQTDAVGEIANADGTLTISPGATITTTGQVFVAGSATNSNGAVYQSTGNVVWGAGSGQLKLGNATGAYGYYAMAGGSLTTNELDLGGSNNGAGTGVLDMSGGTMNETGWFLPARGGGACTGILNFSGGTINYTGPSGQFAMGLFNTSATEAGILNIGGGAGTATFTASGATFNPMAAGTAGEQGITNLLTHGLLQVNAIVPGTAAGTSLLNFNGGTLKAGVSNATFTGANLTGIYVYGGGGTIDNNGANITVANALLAPAGGGLYSGVVVNSGGAGYIGAPAVTINGSGTGATAVATVSGGVVTGITITNPGFGYGTSVPTVVLAGGGPSTAATVTANAASTDVSGPMTFTGSGVTTLSGSSTYTGATNVSGGTLLLSGAGSVNGSSAINVNGAGAKFVQTSTTAVTSPVTLTSGTVDGTGIINSLTVANASTNVVTHGNGGAGQLTIGSLIFNGAGILSVKTSAALDTTPGIVTTTLTTGAVNAAGIVKINVADSDSAWANGVYELVSYSTLGGAGYSDISLGLISGLSGRQVPSLSNAAGFIDLTITGTSGSPVWTGLVNGNWTTSSIASPKNWSLNGSPTDFVTGDNVIFDDTATGAGATTNVTITDATVTPTSVTFNNSNLSYTVAGPGAIAGSGSVTLNGAGNVSISSNNTYTGGTVVNAGKLILSGNNNFSGGSVVVNGGSTTISGTNSYTGGTVLNSGTLNINSAGALGSGTLTIAGGTLDSTGSGPVTLATNNAQVWNSGVNFTGTNSLNLGTGAVSLGVAPVVTVNANTLTVGGPINSTTYGLITAGSGTLVLSGTSTLAGVNVSGGTLSVTGSLTSPNGVVDVGSLSGVNSVLSIAGGTFAANNSLGQYTSSMIVGAAAGAVGDLRMSSGNLNVAEQFGLGAGLGAYAGFTLSGGNVSSGSYVVVGFANDTAMFTQSGGSLSLASNLVTVAASAGAVGVVNFSGGTLTSTAGNLGGLFVGEFGTGILNVSGTAALNLSGDGLRLGVNANASGTVNLLGGTVSTNTVVQGGGTGVLNFNGGTLKATAATTTFMSGLNAAYVYSGGAVIDTGGNNITLSQALLAPTGSGVSATGMTVTGSGYIDAPYVQVTGGGGTGATAVANLNSSGGLTGVTVTNPGVGYTSSPSFNLIGGGGTSNITGTASLLANTSGSLTKKGAGVLTLTGQNTYGGSTLIQGGTLQIGGAGAAVLQAAYSFDNTTLTPVSNGSITTINSSVNNATMGGNASGGVSIVAGGPNINGNGGTGNSLQFDGTGKVDINNGITDLSGTGSWTVSAWEETSESGATLFSKNTSGSWQAGDSVFYTGSGTNGSGTLPSAVRYAGGFVTGSTVVTDGNWHMVTYVDSLGTKSIYVDGVLSPLTQTAFTTADTGNQVEIGFTSDTIAADGSQNMVGNLDDINFYSGALSPTQVTNLFNTNVAGAGSAPPNILPATTAVNISTAGAVLDLNGNAQTIGSLTGVAGGIVALGGGTLTVGDSTSTVFAGTISDSGGGNTAIGGGIIKQGSGTLKLSGVNTYAGATAVTAGTLELAAVGALPSGTNLTIASGAKVVADNLGAPTARNVGTLSISGPLGQLDLNNNALVVQSSTLAAVNALVRSGYNNGAWNGATGIISTSAASNLKHLTALGVIQNSVNGSTTGAVLHTSLDGQTGLVAADVLVKYTYYGDANLDGKVDGTDYSRIDNGYLSHATGWYNGDFNYDGVINGSDYTLIDNAYNTQGASLAAELASPAASVSAQVAGSSAVPEPASLGLLGVCAAGLLGRRRRQCEM